MPPLDSDCADVAKKVLSRVLIRSRLLPLPGEENCSVQQPWLNFGRAEDQDF